MFILKYKIFKRSDLIIFSALLITGIIGGCCNPSGMVTLLMKLTYKLKFCYRKYLTILISIYYSIAESKIPVVSAVGHEIDWALCDYASDVRAPTPSAAAEIVVPEKNQIVQTLQNAKSALKDSVSARIEHLKLLIKQFAPENFEHRIRTIELPFLNRLDNAKTALLSNIEEKILDTKRTVQTCVAVLETANPENILSKGYSMVTIKSSGKILKQKDEVSKGEEVEIRLSKGYVEAVIK